MATATEPKRSFKRTVASTVEGRSPRFLLGSLALAMVISLVAGLGIGIQVGDDDNTTTPATVAKPKAKPKARVNRASAFARPPIKANIVRARPRILVIARGQRRIQMTMGPSTRIEVVRPASRSEVKVGSRVLFVLGAGAIGTSTTSGESTTTADETTTTGAGGVVYVATDILLVTGAAKNRLGSTVSAVDADSMTFRARNGKTVEISTVGAEFTKTIPGTRAKLLPGRRVLIKSVAAPKPKTKPRPGAKKVVRRPIAAEVIALPDGSAFA
jgi:hypothetical protein